MCKEEIKKMFSHLSPTTSFLVGFIGAVLILCTVGFFVFLGLLINGNFSYKQVSDKTTSNFVAQQPTTVQPTQAQPSNNDPTEPAGPVKAVTGRDHIRGDANAKVTLIEYSDFECPFCKRFHGTMKQLLDVYAGKIKWVYRQYPLSFHANAQKEAEASECAYDLGGHAKFWEFADKIYERTTSNGTGFALADLPKLAVEIGLNQAKFEDCLNSGKNKNYITQSLADGDAAGNGPLGTPSTIIITAKGDKRIIKGALPVELMKPVIDQALQP